MSSLALRHAAMDLPLARPFRIARGERTVAPNVLVEVEFDGIVGRGEAAPNARYGQSQDSALEALAGFELPTGATPFDLPALLEDFRRHAPAELAALTGLESALWDWAGRRMDRPVSSLLGLRPIAEVSTPSSWTISIDDPTAIVERVQEAAGWPVYKIKLGGGDADHRALEALRSATDHPFRVDANEAWDEAEAREKLPWLASLGCELVEQPLPATNYDAAVRLKETSPLPLVADEAAEGDTSVEELARAYHGINVKLMKTGGLQGAVHLMHQARQAGLEIMLGCFVESGLGIAAAATLLPLARWADLDGAALLAEDPFEGFRVSDGVASTSGQPGLGVWPRPAPTA